MTQRPATPPSALDSLPTRAGIGLRAPHYQELLELRPALGFIEVHSENYFGLGGLPADVLTKLRESYPLSLHGVGLSLGSTDPISRPHLRQLRALIERYQPAAVSEHLSWSSVDGRYFNDLLPLPLSKQVIDHLSRRIEYAQEYLGRELLVENVSSYLRFADDEMPEWEFVVAVAKNAGCRLLIDINNIFVASVNHGFNPYRYIDAIPAQLVGEIHLAGHSRRFWQGRRLLIDTHNAPVSSEVWSLYGHALGRFGPRPTLIEWDSDLPPLSRLLAEAAGADHLLEACHVRAA